MDQSKPITPPLTAVPSETDHSADVTDLLATMKITLAKVGQILETLTTQTSRVAELRPAMEASRQVRNIHIELEKQYRLQEEQMADVKTLIRDGIKERVNTSLKPRVHDLIQKKVQAKVKERVGKELVNQIPGNLRQEISCHKRQILSIQTSLHNSEARRNNTRLVTHSSDSPLTALLRPSPMTIETSDIERPTPSPHFPKTVQELVSLSPQNLKLLAVDYRLVTPPVSENTEVLLDKLMAHIGIPYQTIPGSASESRPPMIMRITRSD
jgi:hypothetical protein